MVVRTQDHHGAVVPVIEMFDEQRPAVFVEYFMPGNSGAATRDLLERAHFLQRSLTVLPDRGADTEVPKVWRALMDADAPAALRERGCNRKACKSRARDLGVPAVISTCHS
jgi:hypothetical protein